MVIRPKLGVYLTRWHQGPGKQQGIWEKPAEKTVTSTTNERGGTPECTASKAQHLSAGKKHSVFTYKSDAVPGLGSNK